MSKHNLKLGKKWTLISPPGKEDTYLTNPTGTPILAIDLQTNSPSSIKDEEAFTIGGMISQFHADKSRYVFAKALVDGTTEIIVHVNNRPMDSTDSFDNKAAIDKIGIQVMELARRVTDNSLELISHRVKYIDLLRKFITTSYIQETTNAKLAEAIASANKRFISSQILYFKHRKEFLKLKYTVGGQDGQSNVWDVVNNMNTQLQSAIRSIVNINEILKDLIPQVEDGALDIEKLIRQHINPLKKDLKDLNDEFTVLNNALVQMSDDNTVEDINKTFEELLLTAPFDLVPVLEAIKNILIEIKTNSNESVDLSEELKKKVNKTDSIFLTTDIDSFSDLLDQITP